MLVVSRLWAGYNDAHPVVQDVSFALAANERVGLVGHNGSGKSTLLLTLCGVLPPLRGTITLDGVPLVAGAFTPTVNLVFQNPDDQLFGATVAEDVAFGPTHLGLPPAAVAQRTATAMELTNTTHLAAQPPHTLSGGQKRMVAIAGVLAMQPRLVLYDEPDANLDLPARRRLQCFLQAAPHALLLASHDADLISAVCGRVLHMAGGRLVADDRPAVVLPRLYTELEEESHAASHPPHP